MSEQESKESKQYLNRANINNLKFPSLGIDYGEKNIGLAVTDKNGILATPLAIIHRKENSSTQNIIDQIKEYIAQYKIETIVLGLPQAFESTNSASQKKILSFYDILASSTDINVFLYDESYSTVNSYEILQSQGIKMKKAKKKIDKIAATYFLQELIDIKNNYE